MKNNVTMITLAAMAALGGCTSYGEHTYSAADNNQIVDSSSSKNLNHADVRKVQKSLTAEGFYKGKIDGIWGKQTSQAILAYQNAHQQAQTGVMTVETLQEFGVRMDKERYSSGD